MTNMRSVAGAALRTVLGLVAKAGVTLHPNRNAANRITGLRAQWHRDDSDVCRGVVVEKDIDGHFVRFFISDESDVIQQMHTAGQWYETEELKLIERHYQGGTFVDVGANVGNHSLFAAIVLGAPVIAFEPNPPAFRNCLYNFLLNELSDRAIVHNIGLSDRTSNASAGVSPYRNLGSTKILTGEGPLELRTGDDVLADHQVGFLKIDVEGMEMDALRGLEATIQLHRPTMFIEVDDHNIVSFNTWVTDHRYDVVAKLEKWGNANFIVRPRADEVTAPRSRDALPARDYVKR